MVEALLENLAAVSPRALPIAGPATGFAGTAGGFAGTAACATRPPDPLLCLLLWAAMLASDGELDARLLRRAGLSEAELEQLAAAHPQELEQLRRLRLCGAIFSRGSLAGLLRARLSEMLMSAHKPSELLALTKTMERMPQWMWGGEALSAAGTAESAEEAQGLGDDGLEALQLLSEMLNARGSETSEEEVSDMLMRAARLADKLDPQGEYRPAARRAEAHKPSYTKKRQRRH